MAPPRDRCTEAREALAEMALGIADGEARARALAHVTGCADCRRELDDLSAVADDLLVLAPEREPPLGFEARVLERLDAEDAAAARPPAQRRWSWRGGRLRVAAVAAAAAAAVTAAAMVLAYRDDHRLATQYRAALDSANGQFFQSVRLRDPDGRYAGTLFGYQGSPSWLFYVLDGRYARGAYAARIVTRSGRTLPPSSFRLANAAWGAASPVPLRDIAAVRLTRLPRGPTLVARVPVVDEP